MELPIKFFTLGTFLEKTDEIRMSFQNQFLTKIGNQNFPHNDEDSEKYEAKDSKEASSKHSARNKASLTVKPLH